MMEDTRFNPIGFLNELSQKYKNEPVTSYAECTSTVLGQFSIKCSFGHYEVIHTAHTKKEAKRHAADAMINLLKRSNYFEKLRELNTRVESAKHFLSKDDNKTQNYPVCSQSRNPISVLNEYCHSQRLEFPIYTQAHISGSGFVFKCEFKGEKTHGFASNKKLAKSRAAFDMCEKLNLRFAGEKDLLREKEDFEVDNNAVVALNEVLALTKLKAVYERKPSVMNLFVIVCIVGQISGEGRDKTKIGAKISAADQVLQKLLNPKGSVLLPEEILSVLNTINVNPHCGKMEENRPEHTVYLPRTNVNASVLQEFNLDTDEN